MGTASRDADRTKNLGNGDDSTTVASLSDHQPGHPLFKRGDDWEEKILDNLDTVGMLMAGLQGRRTSHWRADSPEKAEVIENESLRLSFRLLHELKHFSKMVLGARERDTDAEQYRVSMDRLDYSGNLNDPRTDRVYGGLSVANAVLKECRQRISRALKDAMSDMVVLANAQFEARAKD